jgi:hypothetical protein
LAQVDRNGLDFSDPAPFFSDGVNFSKMWSEIFQALAQLVKDAFHFCDLTRGFSDGARFGKNWNERFQVMPAVRQVERNRTNLTPNFSSCIEALKVRTKSFGLWLNF